jgi:hypothetical protein
LACDCVCPSKKGAERCASKLPSVKILELRCGRYDLLFLSCFFLFLYDTEYQILFLD